MIGVLGPLEVHSRTGSLIGVGSARHRAVLAALVVDVGRVVSVDALLDRVWGESGSPSTLHPVLSRLRARLRTHDAGVDVATVPPGYRLEVERDAVDATLFLDLLAAARAARGAGDPLAARRHVDDALALWRGPAYADVTQPFAEAEAARLDGQRLAALELAAELDLELGRPADVLDRLPAVIAEHPLRESLYVHLMLALYRSGRQGDALEAFDAVRGRLADELGLDPSPALQDLRQRILVQDPSLGEPLAAAPTAATPVPALRSDVVAPANALLGREDEIAYVRSLLEGSTQRLVTLTGLGGVGKTRLGVAVAEASRTAYRDGVVVVSLAPVTDASRVLPEVARALGLAGVEGLDPAVAVAEHLRRRQVLLVLDNLEHLLAAATQLSRLVASCPELTVLVTSRTVLRVRGEVQYQVQPLPLPEEGETDADALASSAAVALFVDRATAAAPGFTLAGLSPGDAAAVGAICRRLAGLPLAIELAAARSRLMSPRTMLARLDEVLAAGGARDLPPRQRTMRAAIDWSHDLLDERERQLFRRLAVCAGGFTLEAAEAVGGDIPVLATVESLVEHSLVLPDTEHPGVARFHMLEPISQYADLRLTGDERRAARAAHRGHFRAVARELEPTYRGPGTIAGLAATRREQANLVAAVESGLVDGDADTAGRLVWDLWLFWWLSGGLTQGRRLTTAVLEHDIEHALRVRVQAALGAMAFAQADLDSARAAWREGELLAADDGEGRAHNVAGTGLVALAAGDLDLALERFGQAIDLCEQVGLAGEWLWTLTQVWSGTVALLLGDPVEASRRVELSLTAARRRQDPLAVYITLFTAAQIALTTGDPQTARRQLEEGVLLSLETGDLANLAYFVEVLAVVESLAGEHRKVALLHSAARHLRDDIGANVYGYYQPDEVALARALDRARGALGEADYDAATAEGRELSVAQVVALGVRSHTDH